MRDDALQMLTIKKILLTVRAFSYTASVTSVLLGTALAWYAGHSIDWLLFGVTLVGVVLFHTSANLFNDCFDHKRGLDKQVLPVSGGVVRGWYSEKQVFSAAVVLLVLGVLLGLFLVYRCGWVILLLGLAGAVITVCYTRSGFCLKYAGFGDISIFMAFGFLPVFGSYWVQSGSFSSLPIFWSIPLALLTVGILHANNWHDIDSDPAMGCQTMALVLGEKWSAAYYKLLVLGPFALTMLYLAVGSISGTVGFAPWPVAIVMLALPAAVRLTRIKRAADGGAFAMLDARTAQVQLLYGVLLPVAFVMGRLLTCGR